MYMWTMGKSLSRNGFEWPVLSSTLGTLRPRRSLQNPRGRSSALWGRWTSSWRRCHWSTPRGSKNLTMPSRLGLKKATTTSPMPPQRKNTGQCFAGDSRKLRFVAPEELRDAFLWEETRKVDKTGCVKLNGWSLTWVQSLWVDLWTRDSTPST